ncbi:transcription factor jumonji (jmjC) domain-containing protein [Rhynchospora pubera]|uniref:Transcription factor jumonji (JmjC) domain-containing protein n=1 Tax=Rhynchospora pubera TaxID=906938 RepID=A0AAV8EH62_9POAL|nr:transcription factor jumonji (jmjC) domain-containing protein [Rhynchospora pubera]
MEKEKGRDRKGKEVLMERSREVLTGDRRLTRSHLASTRQNGKDHSFSCRVQHLSKKRKLKIFAKNSSEDVHYSSPSIIKRRHIENIIQDTEAVLSVDNSKIRAGKQAQKTIPEEAKNNDPARQRKSSSRRLDSLMCHQCQRNDRGRAVQCAMCCTKRFCSSCITKWYPRLSEWEVAEKCPFCRGYCNCKHCLRTTTRMPPSRELYQSDEIKNAWHVMRYLYPWLRDFHEQQNAEKKMTAEIQGVDARDLSVPTAKYNSKHICCYKCNAYIVDFHWSCRNCTCLLCLSCCRELLEPDMLTTSESLPCVGSDHQDPDSDNVLCESPVLELTSVLGESFISKLYEEATQIINNGPKFEELEDDISKCSCLTGSDGNIDLFCSITRHKEGNFDHFGYHWVKGEPVIVRDMLELASGLSWDPMVMWRALRETKDNGQGSELLARAVNCRDWSYMEINMHRFFMGYQDGLPSRDNWPLLLRLKYCHNDSSLAERLSCHEVEVMDVLPFPEYTNPYSGPLNLVAHVPLDKPRLDLGPKIDIAYGVQEELGEGDSVIKLHYDLYDVVNILMHTKEVHLTVIQQNAVLGKHKAEKDKVQNMTIPDDYGGALWEIWRREDVPKLHDYLTKHAGSFSNHYSPSSSLADESLYLTAEHKRKLKEEYGIEAWTFEQKLGDAVLVPAGCPYQVRNLKSCINVILGFISPESFRVCLDLADDLRVKSRATEAKAEVKLMAVYTLENAMSRLKSEMLKIRTNDHKVDKQTAKGKGTEEANDKTVSDSGKKSKPDNKQEMTNAPYNTENNGDLGSQNNSEENRVTVDVSEPDNKPETGVLTSLPSQGLDGNCGPQNEPNSSAVTMDASDLFYDSGYYVPEPEFHDFNRDRVEKLFKPNQIWAIYGDNDGMPRFYAFIQKVISLSPFEVRMAFLSSHNISEFGVVNWVSKGNKSFGKFHLGQYEMNTSINMFSHQVKWEKEQNGGIKIFPQKGDIWALYQNWSSDWNESTPDETIYKYDLVEILDEYSEENGITVAPLVKVNGFNVVFRKDLERVKQFPRKEMFRFCYQVSYYRLTNEDAGAKCEELTGCVELDPAATPLELL